MSLEVPIRSSYTGGLGSMFPSNVSSTSSDRAMRPNGSIQRVSAHYNLMSPSDIVGPSPVTSTGTASTEIEDEEAEEIHPPSGPVATEPPQLTMLETNIPESVRRSANEESVSVIHAPQSFLAWSGTHDAVQSETEPEAEESERDHDADVSVTSEDRHVQMSQMTQISFGNPTPPLLSTNVKPVRYSVDDGTPRAQDIRDFSDASRGRPGSTSSLEKIDEVDDGDDNGSHDRTLTVGTTNNEIEALSAALHKCWTLCDSLCDLSAIYRARVFSGSGTPDAHERAWKCCWQLCQKLYMYRDENIEPNRVHTTLDLCRDFCQALFDIRLRTDDTTDSVLRVSFELNNHLFSAQDNRSLPEAFRERTLDFYVTLCHRLVKQRAELTQDADKLLLSGWSLAEMLFTLRNSNTNQVESSELVEMYGSTVQACWELCDVFRESWSAVRPDRSTPRPSQPSFFAPQPERFERNILERTESRASNRSKVSKRESVRSERHMLPPPPETPVTEFDETPASPDTDSPVQGPPNILVLGGATKETSRTGRWSSSASNLSSFSQSTAKTSSTATTATQNDDPNIMRVKVLLLKVAMLAGFKRDTASDGKSGMANLQLFVKNLGNDAFGMMPKKKALLQSYKRLIMSDQALPRSGMLPPRNKKVTATELAKAIGLMVHRSSQYEFLRELYQDVFEFMPEAASDSGKNLSIVV